MKNLYQAIYNTKPDTIVTASASIVLIGDLIDRNTFGSLRLVLDADTGIAIGKKPEGENGTATVYSTQKEARVDVSVTDGPQRKWHAHVTGCMRALTEAGHTLPPVSVAIDSTVPINAGFSSSATLEVAVVMAFNDLLGLDIPLGEKARLADKANREYTNRPGGYSKRLAAAAGIPGTALYMENPEDAAPRTIERPERYVFALLHAGAEGALNEEMRTARMEDRKIAAKALGVENLTDIPAAKVRTLPDMEAGRDRRARHVISENARVQNAATTMEAGDITLLGQLMNTSHMSHMSDDGVGSRAVNELAETARKKGAIGARITGETGALVVALLERRRLARWLEDVHDEAPGSHLLAVLS